MAGMALVVLFSVRLPLMEPLTERTASRDRCPKVRLIDPWEGEGWLTGDLGVADLGVTFSPPGQAKQHRVLPVGVTGVGGILSVIQMEIKTANCFGCVFTMYV